MSCQPLAVHHAKRHAPTAVTDSAAIAIHAHDRARLSLTISSAIAMRFLVKSIT